MSFRDILIHVDDNAEDRIAVGRDLAGAFGAHLTGLHIVAFPFADGHTWAHEVPSDVLQAHAAVTDALAQDAERCFTRTVGPVACTWRREDGNPGTIIARTARGYDLVVVGRLPRARDGRAAPTTTERLVLAAGVPTLVVPDGRRTAPLGRRVMVAWNGSREAARAVRDAVPLLRRAESVSAVEISSMGRPLETCRRDLDALRAWLDHHGVPMESATAFPRAGNEGERLLSDAVDREADLIVMGAYGRARVAEIVLGGVTRHMLKAAGIPLMMTH